MSKVRLVAYLFSFMKFEWVKRRINEGSNCTWIVHFFTLHDGLINSNIPANDNFAFGGDVDSVFLLILIKADEHSFNGLCFYFRSLLICVEDKSP